MPKGSIKISQTRKELGLSQLELAVQAGIAVRTLQFAEAGKQRLSAKMLRRIAEALDLPYEEVIQESAPTDDQFDAWPWSLSQFIQSKTVPSQQAFCEDDEDVRNVIQRMRESWGVHLECSAPSNYDEIFRAGNQKLNEQYFRYEDRYLSLWQRHPQTLIVSASEGVRNGASVVLPVTDSAYEQLRDGEISFMDIGPDDILDESQNLVLDTAVEFSETRGPAWYKVTDSLSYAVFCQIAMLAKDPLAEDFRMLSFGASSTNMRRQKSIGFLYSTKVMPEYDFPICEFAQEYDGGSDETYTRVSTTTHYAHLFHRVVGSQFRSATRRRVIARTLSAFQRVVKPIKYDAGRDGVRSVA
ncbi:anaerobic benzoate catabolism transcriptional regulator [Novipirellula galeiformis]|uniref:Anaerobic benzoate catabolism transcriptional regulator n=1 Tax=Novipirellula galeiformis TaxID=2528004 RepID=A0A5C6CTG3_9BACT|nr:helix-turn-helix transcriptional regulator [Novipirellula galeiformis]TWU26904.1 anaerobic benzoate catabolism transcriptional regulator [Novipirellula galeiformis]